MRRIRRIIVLLLCVLMLTACGGDDDYSNETAITYKEGSKELTDADPTHCWVDDNTFALKWFAEGCGGELVEMPFSYTGDFYSDPGEDKHRGAQSMYVVKINSLVLFLTSESFMEDGAHNCTVDYRDDFGHYGEVKINGCKDEPVTIKGFDQKVSRDGLKVFITIIKRAAMKDEKCLARGLGFPHFEFELGGDADHVDHDDQ